MGLTIIEMQAKGIPCIVPFECAGSEYIKDQVNGILYQIGNKKSLIEAIEKTKDDNYIKKIADAFYQDYDPMRFSMERHIDGLVKAYNS